MSGLLRIILIETHLKGVVELKLDAHSNICGTNASGKTTLQRLIPIFYGEYPSRMVPSTRDSFERWYLPREASYIIYEYQQHHGQISQAVLSSGREEQGLKYRFINKAFDLNDYIDRQDQQGIYFTKPGELRNSFLRQYKAQGIQVTRQLNTREFRAIIQNDRSLQNEGEKDLKSFAREFSMCQPQHSLRHIEKLAKAVHTKEGKMETIKSMIATILEENGVTLKKTWLDANKVQDWIQETRLIQKFQEIRPQFIKLEEAQQNLIDNEQRLYQLNTQVKQDAQDLSAQNNRAEREVNQLKHDKQQLEQNWNEQRGNLNQSLSKAEADVNSFDRQLNQIEDSYQRWQDSDIEQAQTNLESIPTWNEQLQDAKQRYQLLTEQHSDIESDYNRRRSDINEQLNHSLIALTAKKDKQAQELQQQQQQCQAALQKIEQQQQQKIAQLQQDFQVQQHQQQLEQIKLNTQLDNLSFSEEQQQQLQQIDTRLEQSREQQQQTIQQRQQANEQLSTAKQARTDATQRLQEANQQVQQQEQQLQKIRQWLYPEDGSLLAYLREHFAAWDENIAKVIEPSLLHRRDLKPQQLESALGLYGLQLDLKAIDTPEFAAQEQQNLARLADAEALFKQAQQQHNHAEKTLGSCNSQVQQVERDVSEARVQQTRLEQALLRLKEEKQLLKESFQADLKQRRSAIEKQLLELNKVLQQAEVQHQEHLAISQENFNEYKLEQQVSWQENLDSLEASLNKAIDAISQRRQQADKALKEAEAWYRGELKAQGLDEETIFALEKAQKRLKQQIIEAEQRREDVSEYLNWLKQVWKAEKPQLLENLQLSQQQRQDAKQALQQATAQHKQQDQQLSSQLKQAQELCDSSAKLLVAAQQVNQKIDALKLKISAQTATPEAAQGTVQERLREAEQELQQQHKHLEHVNQGVSDFDKLLAQHASSDFYDIWERERERHTAENQLGGTHIEYRQLLPELANILNNLLPQKELGLIDLGRSFGKEIVDYYQNLVDVDKRIDSQSRQITRELGEDLKLDGVSGSAVRIRSKIRELEFWAELKEFVSNYQEWQQSAFSQLPPADYASSMKRALEIIGKTALKEGISRLLMIELTLREGNSDLVIRTDRQLNESSSHGMAYLILCKFLLAFTRLLRGNAGTFIHWPIDELGTLHQSNIKKIFDACEHNQIRILGAFPNPESEILELFTHRYIISREKRQLQSVQPRVNALAARLQAKQEQV